LNLGRLRKKPYYLSLVSLVLLAGVFLPLVPVSSPVSIPHNVTPSGEVICDSQFRASNNFTALLECFNANSYPPGHVSSYSSLFYLGTGLGYGPYPDYVTAKQGNWTAILRMVGTKIAYMEAPFPLSLDLNPSGVVKVLNTSISQYAFGMLNFSATVTNLSGKAIWGLRVGFDYPSYGTNSTTKGVVLRTLPNTSCSTLLPAGGTCRASILLNQSTTLLTGQSYPLALVISSVSSTTQQDGLGYSFAYIYQTTVSYPGVGLNPYWVKTFIQAVNKERNATALSENKTLDAFAAHRYNTLRKEYDISDFNFTGDYDSYFHTANVTVFEEILYPQGQDPATFPRFLYQNAPGHWEGLMQPKFTQYGYFFGIGPTVVVGPGCSATEIPGPNINITQYVIDHNCNYIVADQIWFIIILGV